MAVPGPAPVPNSWELHRRPGTLAARTGDYLKQEIVRCLGSNQLLTQNLPRNLPRSACRRYYCCVTHDNHLWATWWSLTLRLRVPCLRDPQHNYGSRGRYVASKIPSCSCAQTFSPMSTNGEYRPLWMPHVTGMSLPDFYLWPGCLEAASSEEAQRRLWERARISSAWLSTNLGCENQNYRTQSLACSLLLSWPYRMQCRVLSLLRNTHTAPVGSSSPPFSGCVTGGTHARTT